MFSTLEPDPEANSTRFFGLCMDWDWRKNRNKCTIVGPKLRILEYNLSAKGGFNPKFFIFAIILI
jgi:hypothetical protein